MAAAHLSSTPLSSSPPSVTNSEASSTHPNHPLAPPLPTPLQQRQPSKEPTRHHDESGTGNIASDDLEETMPDSVESLDNIESEEELLKCQKYEAQFAQRLMAKYFNNQNIGGGNAFDMVGTRDIRTNSWLSTRSYAYPMKSFMEEHDNGLTRATETSSNPSNGGTPVKKRN